MFTDDVEYPDLNNVSQDVVNFVGQLSANV